MSEEYRVRFSKSTVRKMSEWEITTEMRQAVEDRVRRDLMTEPRNHLRSVRAPWRERLNLYTLK